MRRLPWLDCRVQLYKLVVPRPVFTTRIRNYGNVCWWACRDDSINCISYVRIRALTYFCRTHQPSGRRRIRHRNYEHEYLVYGDHYIGGFDHRIGFLAFA